MLTDLLTDLKCNSVYLQVFNETSEMKLKILVGSERKKVLPPWLKAGSDK